MQDTVPTHAASSRSLLRRVAIALCFALLGSVLAPAMAHAAAPQGAPPATPAVPDSGCGSYTADAGWTVMAAAGLFGESCADLPSAGRAQITWTKPPGAVSGQRIVRSCSDGSSTTVLGPYNGDTGTQFSYGPPACPGGSTLLSIAIHHDGDAPGVHDSGVTLTWSNEVPQTCESNPELPICAPPPPCTDDVLIADEVFGGSGGGGGWDYEEDPDDAEGDGSVYWRAYDALDGSVYAWVQVVLSATGQPLLLDQDGNTVNPAQVGFGNAGGGGQFIRACEWPTVDIPPDGEVPEWDGIIPEGAVPIGSPPPASQAPGAGCDFGITDPSSWLCGLAGLFGQMLDILGSILGWLRGLGAFLLGLIVPTEGHFAAEVAEVDAVFDTSAPVVLVDGVTDVITPAANLDTTRGGCQGPLISLPMPVGANFNVRPFDACNELIQQVWHGVGLGLPGGIGGIDVLAFAIYLSALFGGCRFLANKLGAGDPIAEPS